MNAGKEGLTGGRGVKQIVKQKPCLKTSKDAYKVAAMALKSLKAVGGGTAFHAVNRGSNPLGDASFQASGQQPCAACSDVRTLGLTTGGSFFAAVARRLLLPPATLSFARRHRGLSSSGVDFATRACGNPGPASAQPREFGTRAPQPRGKPRYRRGAVGPAEWPPHQHLQEQRV